MKGNELDRALAAIPEQFRVPLLLEYSESQRAAASGDWEKVGLKAGKICEIAYCILEGLCTGIYPPAVTKPQNMQDACRGLEGRALPGTPRAARIQIPHVIAALYELRNNRAIGHAGGDIQPNQMDGLLFNQSVKWLIAEFVRICHNISVHDATKIVDRVSFRWSAAIWQKDGKKRVLIPNISPRFHLLTLLYFSDLQATFEQLRIWLAVKNVTNFRDRILHPAHDAGLVDFDEAEGIVHLLPPGAELVEKEILPRLGQ